MNHPYDLIRDPDTGLELLSKRPNDETPEQERERQFWQLQFTNWRDWLAGDVLAVGRGATDCMLFNKPPPFWLLKAISSLSVRCMSDAEKRARGRMNICYRRWKAGKLVRGQHPRDPLNYKKKVRGDAVWVEAEKLLAGTDAEAGDQAIRKSYELIKRAGGTQVTLPSYQREVDKRDRPRRRRGKNQGRLLPE